MQNGREEARTKDKKLNCMGSSRVSEVERRRGREQPKRPGGFVAEVRGHELDLEGELGFGWMSKEKGTGEKRRVAGL